MRARPFAAFRFAALAALATLGVAFVPACGEDRPTCYEGDYRACECDGGPTGLEMCLASHDGYGACVCDGKTPGADSGAGGGGGGRGG